MKVLVETTIKEKHDRKSDLNTDTVNTRTSVKVKEECGALVMVKLLSSKNKRKIKCTGHTLYLSLESPLTPGAIRKNTSRRSYKYDCLHYVSNLLDTHK